MGEEISAYADWVDSATREGFARLRKRLTAADLTISSSYRTLEEQRAMPAVSRHDPRNR